jgi:hypothetical protein
MVPADLGCIIDLEKWAAGNVSLAHTDQYCYWTLSPGRINQLMGKGNFGKFQGLVPERNGSQRSHALESRRDANT